MQPDTSASLKIKLLFWLILAALSVTTAEVVCSSTPFPFFHPWGLFVVLPLYGVHVVFLAYVVMAMRKGAVSLTSLFLAGSVLGLYEAYITKVLWSPTWGGWTWHIGGVAVVQTAILVLFWHPLMAFVIPLMLGECLFTTSRETEHAMPHWMRLPTMAPRAALGFAVYCGLDTAYTSNSQPLLALASAGSAVGVLLCLSYIWKRVTAGREYRLQELLPSTAQAKWLGGLLAGGYLIMGAVCRPEALPHSFGPHATILLMYAGLIWLLRGSLIRSASNVQSPIMGEQNLWPRVGMILVTVYPIAAAIAALFRPVSIPIELLTLFGGPFIGAGIIADAVRQSISESFRATEPAS